MVCPHNAIQVKGYEFYSVLRSYEEAAARMRQRDRRPSILVFSCQWSEFSALDDPEKMLRGRNAMLLEVPCFKGLDPVHVINALQKGFDGVMAVVCAPEDCKLQKGGDNAARQLEVLQGALKKLGLSERFEMHELSPRCAGEFEGIFERFCDRVADMPSRECQGSVD
jgi:coenzyme F420-reducing hydrogenase delta subunit